MSPAARLRLAYHATTFRAAHLILDGVEGLDPIFSASEDHVFLYRTCAAALRAADPVRFADTGPAILVFEVTGLSLSDEPGEPASLRSAVAIDPARIRALLVLAEGRIERRQAIDRADLPARFPPALGS